MSTELLCLVWSTVLGGVYICTQVFAIYGERGIRSRDPNRDSQRIPGIYAGRAERALRNFLETYPLFIALALVAEVSGRQDWLTSWGSIVYLAGRAAYLPLYVGGFGPLRSSIWTVACVGLAMIFCGVLF